MPRAVPSSLALDPLQEAVHRTLIRLYVRQGQRRAALAQYRLCETIVERGIKRGESFAAALAGEETKP